MSSPYELPSYLWPPQSRGIQATIDALSRVNRVCLYSPTGGGKTAQAIELFNWAMSRGRGGIFYVNRKLLVGQTAARFKSAGLPFGIRAADFEDQYDFSAPFQIASIDTERSRVSQRNIWQRHDVGRGGLVVVDEAHISKSDAMWEALQHYCNAGAKVVLLTATPIGLSDWADELVVSGRLHEYRECKALVPAVVRSIEQPDLSKVKRNVTGEYVIDGQKRKIYTQSIVGSVIDRWKEYNPDARPTMLYAPGVEESVWFTQNFEKIGVRWAHIDATDAYVDGKKAKLTRDLWEDTLGRFKDGNIKGLSNRFKCLDSITQILTKRGWVGVDDFRDDDVVATHDANSFSVNWERVKRVVRRLAVEGEGMYAMKSTHIDVRVTGNHDMVFKSQCRRTVTWKKTEASNLATKRGAYQIPVCGSWPAPGIGLNEHQLRFLGWFLSDGHVRGTPGVNGDVSICQSTTQPEYLHQSIVDSLNGCGFRWKVATYSSGGLPPFKRYTVLASKNPGYCGLAKFIDKAMPLGAYGDISRKELLFLIEGLNFGDGCKRKNPAWNVQTLEIFTGHREFSDNLQLLCVTNGIRCNVCQRGSKQHFIMYISPERSVAHIKGCGEPRKCKLISVPYRVGETVWCVETETGTIFTRRNGKVAVVGNCREGIDVPATYHCILATPIGSLASYIQTVGRVLRYSSETPDHVLVTDHGGNYLRHGSPNHDRDWHSWWKLPENVVSNMHENNIREGLTPEPIRCPKCSGERASGSKCPHCGFEHQKSVRQVIQEDGRMVLREGRLLKPKFIKREPNTAELWEKMFWGWRKSKKCADKTFSQLEGYFAYENGYHPPRDMDLMPKNRLDWHRKIRDIPMSDLTGDPTKKTDPRQKRSYPSHGNQAEFF